MKTIYSIFILVAMAHAAAGQKFYNATTANLPEIVKSSHNSMDAASADIDKDGDLDLIIAVEFLKNIILVNDGSGRFTNASHWLPDPVQAKDPKPYPYYPHHDSEDIAVADFDRDDDLDIIFVSEDDQINELYFNDGTGKFDDVSEKLPVTGTSNAVVAADFNDDGWIDLVIGNKGQNFYLKNANGEFVDETSSRLPAESGITQDLEVADLDGDGDPDLIVGNEHDNTILINNGKGYFENATTQYLKPEHQRSGETRDVSVIDVNSDGRLDFYFANVNMFQQQSPIQRLLINGQPDFRDETSQRIGFIDEHSCVDANFSDLDADGDPDLILTTYTVPLIMANNGEGYFTDIAENFINLQGGMGVDVEIADFNNDGKPDIYFANFRSGDQLYIQF